MRRLGVGVVAVVLAMLIAGTASSQSIKIKDTPTPLPPTATPTRLADAGYLHSPDGWSVSWRPNGSWSAMDVTDTSVRLVGGGNHIAWGIDVFTLDQARVQAGNVWNGPLTFADTSECLAAFLPDQETRVLTGDDDKPLVFESVERSWQVSANEWDQVHYIECRMLEVGKRYVVLWGWATGQDVFNSTLLTELQYAIDSLVIEDHAGTPWPTPNPMSTSQP